MWSSGPVLTVLQWSHCEDSQNKWATPLFAVLKGDGVSELSQNNIVTPVLEIDEYPLLHPEDLMAGHKFSKLHELVSK